MTPDLAFRLAFAAASGALLALFFYRVIARLTGLEGDCAERGE